MSLQHELVALEAEDMDKLIPEMVKRYHKQGERWTICCLSFRCST